jgi:hypothetical protein
MKPVFVVFRAVWPAVGHIPFVYVHLKAASGDEPGAALLISVFFIKLCFVSIGAE